MGNVVAVDELLIVKHVRRGRVADECQGRTADLQQHLAAGCKGCDEDVAEFRNGGHDTLDSIRREEQHLASFPCHARRKWRLPGEQGQFPHELARAAR